MAYSIHYTPFKVNTKPNYFRIQVLCSSIIMIIFLLIQLTSHFDIRPFFLPEATSVQSMFADNYASGIGLKESIIIYCREVLKIEDTGIH